MNSINKQYSFTSLTEFIRSLATTDGWLLVKQGLTLAQEIEDRLQQQDNSSSTADIILLSTLVVEDNTNVKLDDDIRSELHKTDNFLHFERIENKSKRHEWSLVKIDDLIDNFSELRAEFINLQSSSAVHTENLVEQFVFDKFLTDKEFMSALDQRIYKAKETAVKKLTGKDGYKDYELTPWQDLSVNMLMKADKFYNLLSLSPRFGKTLNTNEIVKRIASKTNERVVLLPASKNLASNASFVSDYNEFGFDIHGGFDLCEEGSLFVGSGKEKNVPIEVLIDKRIEVLKTKISPTDLVVMVTDEADIASHTDKAVLFLEAIKSNFNVIKQIAMSGTGIYKASKIFKGIAEEDVHFEHTNYTDLSGYGVDTLVRRNFYNVQFDMVGIIEDIKESMQERGVDLSNLTKNQQASLEIMNVNQAFNQPDTWDTLANYVYQYVSDKQERKLNLKKTKAVMVFTPSRTVKALGEFVSQFNEMYPEFETMILTGNEKDMTNRSAQAKTKEKISTMRKLGINKRLVIFSMLMGSRSYSIPEIRRVVVFDDNEVNGTFYQKISRCLTYDYSIRIFQPIQDADIMRVSFGSCNLAAELFLVENGSIRANEDGKTKTKIFLERSTFCDVVYKENNDGMTVTTLGTNDDTVIVEIDKMMKYTDSTKYIVARLWEELLSIDEDLKTSKSKAQKSSVTLSVSKTKKDKPTGDSVVIDFNNKTSADEKLLETYIDIVRTLPYLSYIAGHSNLQDLIGADWSDIVVLNKEDFVNNLSNELFKESVESIFRNVTLNDESISENVSLYLSYI